MSIQNGDLVRGIPRVADFREEFPVVIGTYERAPSVFLGQVAYVDLVWINSGGVHCTVDCTDIRPAKTGDKETVI
jgi:hypothetical protein